MILSKTLSKEFKNFGKVQCGLTHFNTGWFRWKQYDLITGRACTLPNDQSYSWVERSLRKSYNGRIQAEKQLQIFNYSVHILGFLWSSLTDLDRANKYVHSQIENSNAHNITTMISIRKTIKHIEMVTVVCLQNLGKEIASCFSSSCRDFSRGK